MSFNLSINVSGNAEKVLRKASGKMLADVDKQMDRFSLFVEATARTGIQKGSGGSDRKRGTPSKPNTYPNTQTGRLVKSIRSNRKFLHKEIGSDVLYSKFLEEGTDRMEPRPWLAPSVSANEVMLNKSIEKALEFSFS